MTKKLLILVFINKNNINKEINFIENEFDINPKSIFKYEITDNPSEYVLTFYTHVDVGDFMNVKDYFDNAIIVHKKQKTFYTINALNKLIEKVYDLEVGNIDYKQWDVDWSQYENKLILNSKNNLSIISLKRVFS